jgi:hypothetical protein
MKGLIDLKHTPSDEDKVNMLPAKEGLGGTARYPHGTRISLGDQEMDKLGIEHVQVGDKVHIRGHAHVVSKHQDSDGTGKRMEVHITHMHMKKHNPRTGRAGGKDADMQEGGKAAMDEALQGQEAETAQASGNDD